MSAGNHKQDTKFRLLMLATFLGGLALAVRLWELVFPQSSLLSAHAPIVVHLLYEIGIALMVAPVIALFVDIAAERRLLEAFGEDVSAHVIGNLLPLGLREKIFDYLRTPIVRTKLNILYTIKEWPGKRHYVEISVDGGSDIENRSSGALSWKFNYSVEKSCCPAVGKSRMTRVSLTKLSKDEKKTEFEHEEAELVSPLVTSDDYGETFQKEITLDSGPEGRRPIYHFHFQTIQCRRDDFMVPFTTLIPTLETTITLIDDTNSFETVLRPSVGPDALERTKLANGTEWHIRQPLIRGQGFMLYCRKKATTLGQPPQTGPSRRYPAKAREQKSGK